VYRVHCTSAGNSPFSALSFANMTLCEITNLPFLVTLVKAKECVLVQFVSSKTKLRRRNLIVAIALGCAALLGLSAFYLLQGGSEFPSPSCAALSVSWANLPVQQSGASFLCGRDAVTDGNIKVSLGSYEFSNGSSIEWTYPSNVNGSSCSNSGRYMLANVTLVQ